MFCSRFAKLNVSIALTMTLLFLSGCGDFQTGLYWLVAPRQEIRVIVPDGYVGPVLIGWQVPDGDSAEVVDNAYIYRLQPDGALMLSDDRPQGVGQWSFWYEGADGMLTAIPPSTCFDDVPQEGVVFCGGMSSVIENGREMRPNTSFAITTVADVHQHLDLEYEELLSVYSEQLTIPLEKRE